MRKTPLRLLPLGGVGEVTQNLFVYEFGSDLIVVDCGIGFPAESIWGVDLTIPDVSYLKKRSGRIRGILITHGHEDHLGALPYVLPQLGFPPLWATRLVAAFIKEKLKEFGLAKKAVLNLINPDSDESYQLGQFEVRALRVNHSVPDSVGFVIETPEGRIFHITDFKFDWQSVSGFKFDVHKLVRFAADQPLLLVSDCLGVNTPGFTRSEQEIERSLAQIVEATRGRVFFTTISSNISRMQQAVNVARKYGRLIVPVGRSIRTNVRIARSLGYLDLKDHEMVKIKRTQKTPAHKLLFLIAGSYGQTNSALVKLAQGKYKHLGVGPEDSVIFSADPAPPGTKTQVDVVVDNLLRQGAEVHYYDLQEDLHVSGHGSRGDLALLINLVKPRFLVPIGGTPRHLYAYRDLVEELRVGQKTFVLEPGDFLEFTGKEFVVTQRISLNKIYTDGQGSGDVSTAVIRERQRLGSGGVIVVVVPIRKKQPIQALAPRVFMQGVVSRDQTKRIIKETEVIVARSLEKKVSKDLTRRSKMIEADLKNFFSRQLSRSPTIIPVLIEV
jgi:ribonuclease J